MRMYSCATGRLFLRMPEQYALDCKKFKPLVCPTLAAEIPTLLSLALLNLSACGHLCFQTAHLYLIFSHYWAFAIAADITLWSHKLVWLLAMMTSMEALILIYLRNGLSTPRRLMHQASSQDIVLRPQNPKESVVEEEQDNEMHDMECSAEVVY